jgi:hypothetical protein
MSNCNKNVIFLEKVPTNILKNLHNELELWDFQRDRFYFNRVFEMHKSQVFTVSKYSKITTNPSNNINSAIEWVSQFYPGKKPFWAFFMALFPGQRLPVHRDGLKFHQLSNRIHMPLITDLSASMVFFNKKNDNWETEHQHLTINSAWEVNNIVPHSAENLSSNWRIHLLIDLIDEDILNNQSDLMSRVIPLKENHNLDITFQQNAELEKWTLPKVAENFSKFTSSAS